MSSTRTRAATRGVVFMHCCPSALAPHVEWALAGVLASPVRLQWTGQLQTPRARTMPLAIVGVIATSYSLWALVGAGAEAVLWGAVLLALGAPLFYLVRARPKVAA